MGLRLTEGDEKRFGPATTFYGTVALSFVIPSEAERLWAMSRAGGEFGCGKGVDAIHLENAVRFPLSPNAAAAEGSWFHGERARGLS
jgi:hypothetical protein